MKLNSVPAAGALLALAQSWINTNATASVITGNVTGTPNRLPFKSAL